MDDRTSAFVKDLLVGVVPVCVDVAALLPIFWFRFYMGLCSSLCIKLMFTLHALGLFLCYMFILMLY